MTQDGVGGGPASFIVPAIAGSSAGWTATFDITIIDGVGNLDPADGLSFNYGEFTLGQLGGAEEGMTDPNTGIPIATNNISFEIDTWQNGSLEQGVNIAQIVSGVDSDISFTNGVILNDGTTVSGLATMSWDPVNGASFSTTGLVTNANFVNVPTTFAGSEAFLFGLSARVGGANQTTLVDNLVITTIPEPTGSALLGLAGLAALIRRRR